MLQKIANLIYEKIPNSRCVEISFRKNEWCLVDFLVGDKYMDIDCFFNFETKIWEIYRHEKGLKDVACEILQTLKGISNE